MSVPTTTLTGRAARFLFMLRDFGHLDDDTLDRLVLGMGDPSVELGGSVDLVEARRAAAIALFPGEDGGGPLLAADWPILFS